MAVGESSLSIAEWAEYLWRLFEGRGDDWSRDATAAHEALWLLHTEQQAEVAHAFIEYARARGAAWADLNGFWQVLDFPLPSEE